MILLKGTGYPKHLFADMMYKLRLLRICKFIVHLLAVPPAFDQSTFAQQLQMMRHRRVAHVHGSGYIADTLLTMAQKPQDSQPTAVADLFEYFRHLYTVILTWHLRQYDINILPMIMG